MPYKTVRELPQGVKDALPAGAQIIYKSAFNSALEKYGTESIAAQVAWSAVKAKYTKEGEKWVAKGADS